MNFSRPGLARGFTLMEVLVVLVIVSMLSVLMIDGISQVLQIQVRLAEKGTSMQQRALEQSWFRRVLRGTIADWQSPFEMAPDRISGLTLDPLLGHPGVPTQYSLELKLNDGAVALQYSEGDYESVDLVRWPQADARESFSFSVVKNDSSLGRRWPSGAVAKEQLPKGVGLRMPLIDGEYWWHVALQGRREPKIFVTEDMAF